MIRLLAPLVLLAGCGERQPGPSESEYGAIFYWRVTASDAFLTDCTDNPSFVDDLDLTPVPVDSYLMYRVDSSGGTAMGQSCDTTDPATCSDNDRVWEIAGSTLTYDPPAETVDLDTDCNQTNDELWMISDDGTTGQLEVTLAFGLSGNTDTCAAIDDEISNGGTNEFGIDGCTLTLTADLELFSVD